MPTRYRLWASQLNFIFRPRYAQTPVTEHSKGPMDTVLSRYRHDTRNRTWTAAMASEDFTPTRYPSPYKYSFYFLFGFYGPSRLYHSFWAETIVRWGKNESQVLWREQGIALVWTLNSTELTLEVISNSTFTQKSWVKLMDQVWQLIGYMSDKPNSACGWSGGRTRDPWEKPPHHPKAQLGLSHMWPTRIVAKLDPWVWLEIFV